MLCNVVRIIQKNCINPNFWFLFKQTETLIPHPTSKPEDQPDSCWCFDMFYYPTFFIHQHFRTDLTYMWVPSNLTYLVLNHQQNGWRGRTTFFRLCDQNETLIFMAKFSMKPCLQMSYELVFQRKEGHIFSYHVPKQLNVLKKVYFQYFKVQVSKRT